MKRLFFFFLLINSLLFAQVNVGILNGPSCIPVANMMENVISIDDQNLEFTQFPDAQSLLPKLLKKEIDIGFLPLNVAAKIANSSNNSIICAAVTGMGNLQLITKDKSIQSFQDLKGKPVFIAGQGATPDYMTKYLLSQNLVDFYESGEKRIENGVQLDFSIPTAQLSAELIAGKIKYAVVPEPFATIAKEKDSSITYAIDYQKEYKNVAQKENFPLTVLVVNRKFAEENSQLLAKFLEEYEKSYQQALHNPSFTAELCQKFNFGINKNIVFKAIPKSNFVYIPAKEAKSDIENFLQVFLSYDKNSIGGKLPGNAFYY